MDESGQSSAKKKMVPSDLISNPAHCRHARPWAPRLEVLDVSPFSSPTAVFPGCGIDAYWLAARFSSNRSCTLVTAFRSPVTIALFQGPPFRGQCSRPATSLWLPYGSAARSALRLHNRFTPRGRYPRFGLGCFVASSPLRLFPHGSASRYSRSPLPLGSFCFPQDQSVQPLSLPASSPDDIARSPLAPRRRIYF